MAVKAAPSRAYLVDYASRVPGPYRHEFCGETDLAGATCPHCRRPLTQMLNLDARDPFLDLTAAGVERLPLLFCWGCPSSRASFFYELSAERVGPRRLAAKRVRPSYPYSNYPCAFPVAPARLVALPREVQAHLRALNRRRLAAGQPNDAELPRHQVGGEPLLLRTWRIVTCPCCRKRMPFLAAVADDCLDPRGFSGNPHSQVLFHLCPSCRVVAAYPQRA
jgi:hypothetical protein